MKNKKGRSAVIAVKAGAKRSVDLIARFADDGVTVYAAQAAFFTIIAFIPFLMLLIPITRLIVPEAVDALFRTLSQIIPERFTELFSTIYGEVTGNSGIPIISLTALTAIWSSSRAVASVVRGVASIYDADNSTGIMRNLLYSLLYTVVFMVLTVGVLVILVFGGTIKNIAVARIPEFEYIFSLILNFRGVVFFVILTLFFSLIYFAVAKNILRASGTLRKYRSQLPGAAFAAAGWMLFSYFYSLYLKFYPSASYIYGSLAAVMLMMFWLYFCMVILLAGAEINKMLSK